MLVQMGPEWEPCFKIHDNFTDSGAWIQVVCLMPMTGLIESSCTPSQFIICIPTNSNCYYVAEVEH